jgi:peptidoglycan/xylan/chitin deacetylase (PgdA/CDA1 family)
VALTFDDGPGPKSAELSERLRDENVPATFFVLGESIDRYGEVLETHRACGHAIGAHGNTHRAFASERMALRQLGTCRDKAAGHLDGQVWFRPPYGRWDRPLDGYAGPVGWHTHGRDWDVTYRQGQTVEGCVDLIASDLSRRGGGIVLLHDFAPHSEFEPAKLSEADLDLRVVDIVTLLIARLKREGFSFVGLPAPEPALAV